MRNVVGRFWFLCGFAGLLPVSAIAQNATFSLVPRGVFIDRECVGGPREGQTCTTTSFCEVFPDCDRRCKGGENDGQLCAVALDCDSTPCEQKCFCNYVITASPGDEIVTEIFGSNWSPMGQHLLSWSFAIEGEVYGDTIVLPKGVDNPQLDCNCVDDAECIEIDCDEGRAPVCWDLRLICAGPDQDPTVGAFIDIARSDYVFFGCIDFPTVDLISHTYPGYRYVSTVALDPSCAPLYSVPKYFGTLKLIVQDDACDPFTVSIQSSSGSTLMLVRENSLLIEPLDTEGLTVNVVGECPCDEIISMTPAECSVDPRQPSEPNGTPLYGWDSMELKFRHPGCKTETLGLEDFAVTQIPSGPPRIGIAPLEPNGRFLTVRFSRTIVPKRWTCLDFFPPQGGASQRLCLGSLPGDADDDREALAAEDVPSIVDCVDETDVPCDTLRCDMDRSGRCAPADILRVIDLLQGAEAYAPGFEDAMLSTSECAPVLGAALFSPDLTGTDSDRSSRRNTGRRQRR